MNNRVSQTTLIIPQAEACGYISIVIYIINISSSFSPTLIAKIFNNFLLLFNSNLHFLWILYYALSVNGKRKDITKDDLLILGKSINVKKAEKIISQINDKISNWNNYAEEVSVKAELRDAIKKTLINIS